MKHFICTHTFHSEETKTAYFEDNKDITSKEWFASVEGEKVKCIQHWLGDQDFGFVIRSLRVKIKYTKSLKP